MPCLVFIVLLFSCKPTKTSSFIPDSMFFYSTVERAERNYLTDIYRRSEMPKTEKMMKGLKAKCEGCRLLCNVMGEVTGDLMR